MVQSQIDFLFDMREAMVLVDDPLIPKYTTVHSSQGKMARSHIRTLKYHRQLKPYCFQRGTADHRCIQPLFESGSPSPIFLSHCFLSSQEPVRRRGTFHCFPLKAKKATQVKHGV